MKRRDFLGFFLIGGLIALMRKMVPFPRTRSMKEARYWRRT